HRVRRRFRHRRGGRVRRWRTHLEIGRAREGLRAVLVQGMAPHGAVSASGPGRAHGPCDQQARRAPAAASGLEPGRIPTPWGRSDACDGGLTEEASMKIACCFTVLVAVTFGAGAAPQTIKLPEEVAKLRPSDLPGAKVAARACVVCHSADYINYQPPGMSLTQWTGEVAKMQHTYGAPITDNEVKLIGAYL